MNCGARSEPPALSLRGVSFAYGKAEPVLRDVHLDIQRGDLFGLLGPNGAGKTTLISLLCGLLPLSTGEIWASAEPLAQLRRRRPALLSLVPQDYAFYPMLTTMENLRFFAGVQGLRGASAALAIDQAVAFARLEQAVQRRAGELSGGLKRRLNLAIGLLNDPDILLLDEPTAGVDPQSRHFLLESIASLRAKGKTVVYTSHYMDEIEALCERVAIIDAGRILVSGSLDQVLLEANDGKEVDAYLRLRGALPQDLANEWSATHGLQDSGHHAYRLRIKAPAELQGLLQRLEQAHCCVLAASCGQRNLEEVFMHLTRRSLRD